MGVSLFFTECKVIFKSIIYLVFICAIILFYSSQFGGAVENDINEYYANEEQYPGSLQNNPLIKPLEGADGYGQKYVEIPEQIMLKAVSSIATDWNQNDYVIYPFGFGRHIELNAKKRAETAKIITDITGMEIEDVLDAVLEKRMEYLESDNIANFSTADIDYSGAVPIIITYDEYKDKMKQLDKILGGPYGETNFQIHSFVPMTYEEALSEYNAFVSEDKITGAYARLFCDYMGIVAALLSVFVPVAFLMRDKRAKANELIYSRGISSAKFILARYAALIFMMILPFLLLSIIPSAQLINFAFGNNMDVDIFAFAKYVAVWILPTLMTTAAAAMVCTAVTDTPIAIAVQFLWSFISLTVGGFAAYNSGTGNLVHYGMNLIIRHNTVGSLEFYKDNFAQLVINRTFYTVLSVALVVLTIFIYEKKRRGEADVRGSLRKIFRNRESAS